MKDHKMVTKVLALLALVSVVGSNDVIVGLKTDGTKFFDENRQANPAIWRQMNNVTITAPENEVISRIVITDLRPEKDGDVKVVDGGEGHKNVTIELKSPTVLRGYEFHIEVFSSPGGDIPSNNDPQSTTKDELTKTTDQASSNNPETNSKMPDSSTIPNAPAILSKDGDIMDSAREGRNAKNEDISTEATTEIASTTFKNDLSTTKSTESVTENHSDKTSEFNTQDHKYPVSPIPLNRNIKIGPYVPVVSGSDLTNNKENRNPEDEPRHTRDTEAEKSSKSTDHKLNLMPVNLHLFESSSENDKEVSTTEVSDVKPVEEKSADEDKEDNLNAPKAFANDYHKFTSIIPSKVEHSGKPITEKDAEKQRNARDINEGEKVDENGSTTESGESTTANFKDTETTTLSSDECVTSESQEHADARNPLNAAGNQGTRDMVYLNDRQWNGRFNNPRFQSQDSSGDNNERTPDNVNFPAESKQPISSNAESLGNSYRPSPDYMENKNPKISGIEGFRGRNEPVESSTQ